MTTDEPPKSEVSTRLTGGEIKPPDYHQLALYLDARGLEYTVGRIAGRSAGGKEAHECAEGC